MVPNFITIVFTVTPSCLQHPNQCLSGHRRTWPLTVTSLSCSSLNYVQFSQGTVLRAGHSVQACTRLPVYPRNLLALGQAPRYLSCSGRLLRFKEMVLSQSQDQRSGDCRRGPKAFWKATYLAHIQVRLQVVGVIELQDPPKRSPFLALPGKKTWTRRQRRNSWWVLTSP